jgi:hypothetical protein
MVGIGTISTANDRSNFEFISSSGHIEEGLRNIQVRCLDSLKQL